MCILCIVNTSLNNETPLNFSKSPVPLLALVHGGELHLGVERRAGGGVPVAGRRDAHRGRGRAAVLALAVVEELLERDGRGGALGSWRRFSTLEYPFVWGEGVLNRY